MEGKRFEEDFKRSVPDYAFILRLNDSAGWRRGGNTRFTPSNLCDFILFANGFLYLVELKSYTGKSVPAQRLTNAEKLSKIQKNRVIPCYVINFRDHEETYAISAGYVCYILEEKRSVSIEDCKALGRMIGQEKKVTRWRYSIDDIFSIKTQDKLLKM